MPPATEAYAVYALAWLGFGVLHSILAGHTAKTRLTPVLGRTYRLQYNIFAAVTFAVTLWVGHTAFADIEPFDPPGNVKILLGAASISGWFLMYFALQQYDLGLFAGTRQLRGEATASNPDGDEPLRTGGLNRFVRHPIYSAAFLILWGAAWTPFGLATALLGSAYILIGTYCEERKLIARYGNAYRDYRRRVPAYVPWRGRAV